MWGWTSAIDGQAFDRVQVGLRFDRALPGMATSGERSITLPADTASVKVARAFVASSIADFVDDPAEVLLMTSELVSNVVGHVGSAVTIAVGGGPLVRIEVHNHDAATEAFRDLLDNSAPPAHTSPTGRGLCLVRSLASRVGLDDDVDGGKVVWFEWEPGPDTANDDAVIEADGEPVAVP